MRTDQTQYASENIIYTNIGVDFVVRRQQGMDLMKRYHELWTGDDLKRKTS